MVAPLSAGATHVPRPIVRICRRLPRPVARLRRRNLAVTVTLVRSAWHLLLGEPLDVADHGRDLIVAHLAAIARHRRGFAHRPAALLDDLGNVRIAFAL